MTLDFNPDGDFAEVVDGLETVILRRRGSSGATVVTGALRRAATAHEAAIHNRYNTEKVAPGGGRHVAGDVTWHLPAQQIADAPRPGDLIVDGDGRRWTVLAAVRSTLGTRWQCAARNVAVVYGLDDTVTILQAAMDKGEGGAAEPTWQIWRTGVRARIQPAAVEMGAEHQARRTTARYQIFVEEDVALDHHHRIQGPDGTVYRIRATLGADRIGEMQTIDAEVIG